MTVSFTSSRPRDEAERRLWAVLDAELAEPDSVTDDQWEAACAPYRDR